MVNVATCTINGHDIVFVDGDILLSKNAPLHLPEFIGALSIGQKLYPLFEAMRVVVQTRRADGTYSPSMWQYFSDDEMARCIEVWTQYAAESSTTSDEQAIVFPDEIAPLIHEMVRERLRRIEKRERENTRRAMPRRSRQRQPGYVYLIRSASGYHKIGRSKDPENRMATFSVKLPFEVEFECLIECEDMAQAEQELHDKFEHKRVNGEWFALSDEDVAYIKSLGGAA